MKKLSIMVLALLVVLSGFATPAIASTFGDTSGHWAQADIERWSEKHILNGYDGRFRPDDPITRAEFATVLNNILRYIDRGVNTFSDLNEDEWYADAMLKLNAAGVMNGSGGQAMPNKTITRQEAAVMVARAFRIDGVAAHGTFTDTNKIASWASEAVAALVAHGVLNGKPDGSFDPTGLLSRAEAARILTNLIAVLYAAPGEYSRDVIGNVVINTDDVTLKDMRIWGDLYIAQGVGEGEVTLDHVIIEGTVIVEGGGENSIIFHDVNVKGSLIVDKHNGAVRILATGNTSVSITTLESGALIVTRELTGGGFETIEISEEVAAGQRIILEGSFDKLVNRNAAASITANGKINELLAEADTSLNGEVEIARVTSSAGAKATVNGEIADSSVGSPPTGVIPGGGAPVGGIPSGGGGNPGGGNPGGDNPGDGEPGDNEEPGGEDPGDGEPGDNEEPGGEDPGDGEPGDNEEPGGDNPGDGEPGDNEEPGGEDPGDGEPGDNEEPGGEDPGDGEPGDNEEPGGDNPGDGEPGDNEEPGGENPGEPTDVPVTGVEIDQHDVALVVGQTAQLTVSVWPSNATNPSVTWQVLDGNPDVASVGADGSVQAISVGTERIIVTTEDGQYTDEITVHVTEPALSFRVTPFTAAMAADDAEFDRAILENSTLLSMAGESRFTYENNLIQSVLVVGEQVLSPTSGESSIRGNYANLVVTLVGPDGKPFTDIDKLDISVVGATYETVTGDTYGFVPQIGHGLAVGAQDGSFIFMINAGDPEEIREFELNIEHEDSTEAQLMIRYIPHGMGHIVGIGEITGDTELGAVLTAGEVRYVGNPTDPTISYQWYRGYRQSGGLLTPITGATSPEYQVTEDDVGYYLILKIEGEDMKSVSGTAFSGSFGPIGDPIELPTLLEVIEAIEGSFLADNPDADHVTSSLKLMKTFSEFPSVRIDWTSDDDSTVNANGTVSRNVRDRQVLLTARIYGASDETMYTHTFSITVKGLLTYEKYKDEYFAEGYPQAYVKDDNIWVKVRLNEPAEVFMVVKRGLQETSVVSVIEGHAGSESDVSRALAWPYVRITDAYQEMELDTGVKMFDADARIDFVIRTDDYLSAEVTTNVVEKAAYVDRTSPNIWGIYLNQSREAIYVYFDEALDLTSKPDKDDFHLNVGTITDLEMHNYDRPSSIPSYVTLHVTGISEDDADELYLSYDGTAIRDTSGNMANSILTPQSVRMYAEEAQIVDVLVSSDRSSILVTLNQQINASVTDYHDFHRYEIRVDGQRVESYFESIHLSGDSLMGFQLTLLSPPLPEGELTVVFDTSELVNMAYDPYPEQLVSRQDVIRYIPQPGKPNVTYYSTIGSLYLTFNEGFQLGHSEYTGGFIVIVDGEEYALRGSMGMPQYRSNEYVIQLDEYSQQIKQAIEQGTHISLKYVKQNETGNHQLIDVAGGLVPDFDEVEVVKIQA